MRSRTSSHCAWWEGHLICTLGPSQLSYLWQVSHPRQLANLKNGVCALPCLVGHLGLTWVTESQIHFLLLHSATGRIAQQWEFSRKECSTSLSGLAWWYSQLMLPSVQCPVFRRQHETIVETWIA